MAGRTIKVFISSPMDVKPERAVANNILDRLDKELHKYVGIQTYRYEYDPFVVTSDYQKQISDPGDTDIFLCILWSRLGTPLPEAYQKKDGSRFLSGTEYEYYKAIGNFNERGRPFCLIFHKMEAPPAHNDDDISQKRALDDFLNAVTLNPDGTIKGALNEFHSTEEFEELLLKKLRKLIIHNYVLPGGQTRKSDAEWLENPFMGLGSFNIEHAPVFFGRDNNTEELKNLLVAQDRKGKAFSLVLGMSGSGKSSFVSAGLLPALMKQEAVPGRIFGRSVHTTPGKLGDNLIKGLAYAFYDEKALPELTEVLGDRDLLYGLFLDDIPAALMKIAQALELLDEKESLTGRHTLILFIDQFEELFSVPDISVPIRDRFTRILSEMSGCGRVWVVAAMRSDYYYHLSDDPIMLDLKEGGQYDLLPPNIVELSEIIRYPAFMAGLTFGKDPGTGESLDDILLEVASRDPSSLPLLEFTLYQLYQKRKNDKPDELAFDAYCEIGGMTGALQRHAEEVLKGLPPQVQTKLPEVFRALASLEAPDVGSFSARRASRSSISADKEKKTLIDAFINGRLLISDSDSNGNDVVRVAHEALLNSWPRLTGILQESREFIEIRQEIEHDFMIWENGKKSRDLLIPHGKRLSDAVFAMKQHGDELDPQIKYFIRMSDRKAKKIALVRQVLAVAAFIAAIVFIVVLQSKNEAYLQVNRELEGKNQENLQINQDLSQANQDLNNEKKRVNAELAVSIAGQSVVQINNGDRMAGLMLAMEANKIGAQKDDSNVRGQLESAFIQALHNPTLSGHAILYHQDNILMSSWSPDNNSFLTLSRDGVIRIWDSKNGEFLVQLSGERANREFTGVAFAKNGQVVLTFSRDGLIEEWNASNGQYLGIVLSDIYAEQVRVSGNRMTAFININKGGPKVGVFNLEDEKMKKTVPVDKNYYITYANYDGTVLAIDTSNGYPVICDVATDNLININTSGGYSDQTALAVSPDGNILAVGLSDGTLQVMDIKTASTIFQKREHSDAIQSIDFCDNGRYLATGSKDKTIKIWDLDYQMVVGSLSGHTNEISSIEFSADKQYLASSAGDNTVRLWTGPLPWFGEVNPVTYTYDSNKEVYAMEIKWLQREPQYFKPWYTDLGMQSIKLRLTGNKAAGAVGGHDFVVISSLENGAGYVSGSDKMSLDAHNAYASILSPDEKTAVTLTLDGDAYLWDARKAELIRKWPCDAQKLWYAEFDSTGQRLVTADRDGVAAMWDLSGNKSPVYMKEGGVGLFKAAFSPDGSMVLTADIDHTVRLYDAESGKALLAPLIHTTGAFNLNDMLDYAGFSNNGAYIVTASRDGSIIVWDIETGEKRLEAQKSFDEGKNIVISIVQGGEKIIFNYDFADQYWIDDAGNRQAPLDGLLPSDLTYDAVFNKAGTQCVSIAPDNSIRLYDSGTGKSLMALSETSDNTTDVVFDDDRKVITLVKTNGGTIEWNVQNSLEELVLMADKTLDGRVLTDQERLRYSIGKN